MHSERLVDKLGALCWYFDSFIKLTLIHDEEESTRPHETVSGGSDESHRKTD